MEGLELSWYKEENSEWIAVSLRNPETGVVVCCSGPTMADALIALGYALKRRSKEPGKITLDPVFDLTA